MPKLNIIGKKFNRLLVLNECGKTIHHKTQFMCLCDCGNQIKAVGSSLVSGNTNSCGCYRNERAAYGATLACKTHGLSYHPLYNIWIDINRRCYNNKVSSYKDYGGRGITVCDEWRNSFKSFYNWCKKNGWEAGLEIDRYPNNNGNYEPNNCRLATCMQNQNNKRNNRLATIDGVTKTAAEWGRITGINPTCIATRIRNGLSGKYAVYGVGKGNKFAK